MFPWPLSLSPTLILLTIRSLAFSHTNQARQQAYPVAPQTGTPANLYAYSSQPVRTGLLTNFPDPSIYYDGATSLWYAFGTQSPGGILALPDVATPNLANLRAAGLDLVNIQVASSPDLVNWTLLAGHDAVPDPGAWAVPGGPLVSNVWAPEVVQHPSTREYLMYYTAQSANTSVVGAHCIGAATSSTAVGPYTPVATPIVCLDALGGSIDPSIFIEPATDASSAGNGNSAMYLAYKVDGNRLGHGGECGNTIPPYAPTPILLQRLLSDGLTADPTYTPVQLLDRETWANDGPLIEAPSLVRVDGTYYLFFSSGCVGADDYDVKYATAPLIEGPYTRATGQLLATGMLGLTSPGSATVRSNASEEQMVGSDGQELGWSIVFHARVNTSIGGVRALFVAGLEFL